MALFFMPFYPYHGYEERLKKAYISELIANIFMGKTG